MTIGERIKKVRTDSGDNQEEFARKIGITRSAISLYESGNRTVTEPTIKLVCSTYNVSYDWLKTGKGDPYIKNDNIEALIATCCLMRIRPLGLFSKLAPQHWMKKTGRTFCEC